jgi:hypothetical protein
MEQTLNLYINKQIKQKSLDRFVCPSRMIQMHMLFKNQHNPLVAAVGNPKHYNISV